MEKGGADIVLCGAMTEDITNLVTSPAVAFMMDYPHISNVTTIKTFNEEGITGEFEMDEMIHSFRSQFPIVMSITRKLNEPRLATKIQILKVPLKKITTMTMDDLGLKTEGESGPCAHYQSYTPITKERKRVILSGEIDDIVDELLQKVKEENVL